MVKRSGKGDYCRKAKNHPEECLLEGRKFAFRARISAPGQNFRGLEIPEFLALKNSAKSFTKGCGAAFGKGPEILRNQNFRGPEILRIFAKSFLSSCGATFCKGPEFSE
jgi:hypothetical protein